jgi:hypothetical protein
LPDKLTVAGTVCTDDPTQADFPVKILFVIDSSSVMPLNDKGQTRISAVEEVVGTLAQKSNYQIGLLHFGGEVVELIKGGFTRNRSEITAAVGQLAANKPVFCRNGQCRDIRGALERASDITGDILSSDAGMVSRTRYLVVLLTSGAQAPPLGRCDCRDRDTELSKAYWGSCGSVTASDGTQLSGWAECDTDRSIGRIAGCPADLSTLAPALVGSSSCPDTFTHWIPPSKPELFGFDTLPSSCKPCELCCIYPAGGRGDSCEERLLAAAVRDLRAFAVAQGVAGFQLHTAYLPDSNASTHSTTSLFRPLACGSQTSAADRARTQQLLVQMAFAGGGEFKLFFDETSSSNMPVSFEHLDFFETQNPLSFKELVATNVNAISTGSGLAADSDQDGLPDAHELQLGTCERDFDSDGDGVNDNIEVKLARDPLVASEPLECIDLPSTLIRNEDLCASAPATTKQRRIYHDKDGDQLNACEERLLGTDDSLIDSDADGIADKVELTAGTNYLAVDHLRDFDFDGIVNRDEVRSHTDPRANDSQDQLDLAYRYKLQDNGIEPVVSVSQAQRITGIKIKSASAHSSGGVGSLRFHPRSAAHALLERTRRRAPPASSAPRSTSLSRRAMASSYVRRLAAPCA